jgi:Transport protein Avl9
MCLPLHLISLHPCTLYLGYRALVLYYKARCVPTEALGRCNRQIATSTLLSKEADVTRSTVQKAIVLLASKPLFGLIRDKLGVVTRAFFNQRDFRDHSILIEFCDGLETSLRAQLTESAVYMGVFYMASIFGGVIENCLCYLLRNEFVRSWKVKAMVYF